MKIKTSKRLMSMAAAAGMLGVIAAIPAQAASLGPLNFSGTGPDNSSLSASVLFDLTGNTLTITLTNTATGDNTTSGQDVPGNTLTGVFFDMTGATLTANSAMVAAGSQIIGTCDLVNCTGVTDVSGEFAFQDGLSSPFPASFGLASAGYISGTSTISSYDLDWPASVDGINFGIISNDASYAPNGGLENEPVIENAVVFSLTCGGTCDLSNIGNVAVQYGTSLSETTLVPVPAAVWLFGSGLMGIAAVARRKKAA